MEEKIMVAVKKVDEAVDFVEIDNTLEAVQAIVGGYIEIVEVDDGLYMVCDEEGKLKGKAFNFELNGDYIVGDVFFVRVDDEGDFASLDENDIYDIEDLID